MPAGSTASLRRVSCPRCCSSRTWRLQAQHGRHGRLRCSGQSSSERNYYAERERLFSAVVEFLQRRHHHEVARGRDHVLEQGGRAGVRLLRERSGRPAGRSHPAAESQREERQMVAPAPTAARSIDQLETVRAAQERPQMNVLAAQCPAPIHRGQDRRRLQGRARHHRAQAHRGPPTSEIEERQRIFETSQDLILVTDRQRQFPPDQPERRGHPRLRAGGR